MASIYTSPTNSTFGHTTGIATMLYTIVLSTLIFCYRFSSGSIHAIATVAKIHVSHFTANAANTSRFNISVSNDSSGILIHLNGNRHDEKWQNELWKLCALQAPTRLFCHPNTLKVCIVVRLDPALSALRGLSQVLTFLNRYSQLQARAAHPLDLTIRVTQDAINPVPTSTLRTSRLRFTSLAALRTLTWTGPCSELFFVVKQSDGIAPRISPRLTNLSLSQCLLTFPAVMAMLVACPALTRCEIDTITDATAAGYIADATVPARITHQHLKHLEITSSVGLRDFFHSIALPYLDNLTLWLSGAATREPHTIQGLEIPWRTLQRIDISAPLCYADLLNLKRFLDRESTDCGRWHDISDWSSTSCRALRGFKARTIV